MSAQSIRAALLGRSADSAALRLGALLVGAGAAHFAVPKLFDQIVPPQLPGPPRRWTHASGVAEIALGGALLAPATRAPAALGAALLFTAVFPANIHMARLWSRKPPALRALAYARLPLQVPLVTESIRVYRSAARS
jgi:uncharacterized membrane protein